MFQRKRSLGWSRKAGAGGRLLGAQDVAPVDQRHLFGEIGQEQRFLDGRVAAADDRDLLAAIEGTITGGAGRDAITLVAVLGRPSHFACAPVAMMSASQV